MNLTPYVDELREQLAIAADTGGPEAIAMAEKLATALEAATRLVLLDALSAAAGEITRSLAPGSVDLRLRGREPEFVVTPAQTERIGTQQPSQAQAVPPPRAEPPETDEGGTTRTTLRLPDHLKVRMESAAGREGLSVNTWLIRAVTAALEPKGQSSTRDSGGGESFTGWVR